MYALGGKYLGSLTSNHIISSSSVWALSMGGVTTKSTMIPGYAYTGDLYSFTAKLSCWSMLVGLGDNELVIVMSSFLKVGTTY